jgi:CubicO group peptidase (beta-lactamase class C family)
MGQASPSVNWPNRKIVENFDVQNSVRSRVKCNRGAAVLLVLVFAALSCRRTQADEALQRAVDGRTFDQLVEATLLDYAVPGAVVAVASADDTVFLRGYGLRRRGATGAVDENTRFQIASMSKFIAATAIATLVDRGVVSWDAPVRTFSPDSALAEPYATENATLRDYLAHRTGLPAYAGDLLTQLGYGPDELVRRARFLPFGHSFRAEWAYSNYGILLGQQAAAHAAGISAPELLSTGILQPLRMTRSGPTQAELFKDDNRAAAHDRDGSVMPYENVDSFSGAGAVVSTGADITRWMRMLLGDGQLEGQQILAKATVTEIFAASMVQGIGGPLQDPNDSAGLGCESYHFLRYRVIEKNGALNGVRTIVTLIPERRLGIAVFANKQLTVFPEAVRAAFLERELGPSGRDLQAQIRAEQAAWDRLLDVPKAPTDPKQLERGLDSFAGHYVSDLFGSLVVLRNDNTLDVRIGPLAYPGRLTHWSGDTFLLIFGNPDIAPGLLTFEFGTGSATAAGIDGTSIPRTLTTNYGHFSRAP